MHRGFANVILLAFIVVLLGVSAYFTVGKHSISPYLPFTQKISAPFSLSDSNARYYLEKQGSRYTLNYAKGDANPISIYVSSDTKISLDQYVGQNLIVTGEFKKEKRQVECIKAPCNSIDETVIHPTGIELAPLAVSSPSPTSGETANPDLIGANWKTYKSTCGFILKYPPNLIASTSKKSCDDGLNEGSILSPDNGQTLWINMYEDLKPKSTDFESEMEGIQKSDQVKTTIANYPAVKTKIFDNQQAGKNGNGFSQDLFILKDGKFYRLFVTGDKNAITLFSQILSTFKFTN